LKKTEIRKKGDTNEIETFCGCLDSTYLGCLDVAVATVASKKPARSEWNGQVLFF